MFNPISPLCPACGCNTNELARVTCKRCKAAACFDDGHHAHAFLRSVGYVPEAGSSRYWNGDRVARIHDADDGTATVDIHFAPELRKLASRRW